MNNDINDLLAELKCDGMAEAIRNCCCHCFRRSFCIEKSTQHTDKDSVNMDFNSFSFDQQSAVDQTKL